MDRYIICSKTRRLKVDLLDAYPAVEQYTIRGSLSLASKLPSDTLTIIIGFEPAEIKYIDLCIFNSGSPCKDTTYGMITVEGYMQLEDDSMINAVVFCKDLFKEPKGEITNDTEITYFARPLPPNHVNRIRVTLYNPKFGQYPFAPAIKRLSIDHSVRKLGEIHQEGRTKRWKKCELSTLKRTKKLAPAKKKTITPSKREKLNMQKAIENSVITHKTELALGNSVPDNFAKPKHEEKEKPSARKKSAKKIYSNIPEDGWCTPWAETLDTVNVYFFQINDSAEHHMFTEYAKRLGAGITDNISEATHIVSNAGVSNEILKDLVLAFEEEDYKKM